MRSCIICIGNRFVAEDAAGPAVYDRLRQSQPLPADIELVDGGLMGLNLLPFLERGGRVVFVDAVQGFGKVGDVVLLGRDQIDRAEAVERFDHGASLAYLLAIAPQVCEGDLPEEIVLVGVEGMATPHAIELAATLSLNAATHGMKEAP